MKGLIHALVLICAIFLANMAFSKIQYNPSDVDKYNNTGACPSCDLSNVLLFCQANSVLDKAILNNAHFGDPRKCDNSSFQSAYMVGTQLGNSSYALSNFSNAKMTDMSVNPDANLSSAKFNGADLSGADLSGVTLTRTDFTGANLAGANLSYTDLTESNITEQQLKSAKSYCNAILPNGSKAPPCR